MSTHDDSPRDKSGTQFVKRPLIPTTPCATCGRSNTGGMHGHDWFVCWQCNLQGVEWPPMPELQRRLEEALLEGLRRERPGHVITIETTPEGIAKRDAWAQAIEREGSVTAAIVAMHAAKVAAGEARPLTNLLDAGEAAALYGVTRPTFRRWLKQGKRSELTRIDSYGTELFREDEILLDCRS